MIKSFLRACKQIPIVLWVSLFVYLPICTFECVIVIDVYHTPLGLMCYLWLVPIIILMTQIRKPLNRYEKLMLVFYSLLASVPFLPAFLYQLPLWVFLVLCVLFSIGMLAALLLGWRAEEKAQREEFMKAFLDCCFHHREHGEDHSGKD